MTDNMDHDDNDNDEWSSKSSHKHDSGLADLEKVTDYVEEKEMSNQQFTQVETYL